MNRSPEPTFARNETPTPAVDAAQFRADARYYGNMLSLWRLCGRVACRGDGLDCFRRCVPLTPAPVRAFLAGLNEAQQEGMTWEETTEELWQEWRAVREWQAMAVRSLPGSR